MSESHLNEWSGDQIFLSWSGDSESAVQNGGVTVKAYDYYVTSGQGK